ncbi:2-polyprenyl-3-methyl-6-methoxy-1,4-benzoquinone monooxygenase [Sphaerotilus sp.]|uniref:2-polyprenyl-3-methyl-6-methoxy-1,4-benzoquinone monooxygenase n=1 Tax=Sphaerotilus sp. TaxID=2093942 RepID=UPI0034E1A61B
MDRLLSVADQSLRTIWGHHHAQRPAPRPEPAASTSLPELDEAERRLSGALIRVDHVGEVCAQALYTAQALATRDEGLRAHLEAASQEETDHLAWTEQRLRELGDRPSLLNPLWYAGAFAIGTLAARLGDRASLGFVIETERQVEAHLDSHLARLPKADLTSRAIVTQMRDDEIQHAEAAQQAGGVRPPVPVRWLMRAAAKVMTTTAHHI